MRIMFINGTCSMKQFNLALIKSTPATWLKGGLILLVGLLLLWLGWPSLQNLLHFLSDRSAMTAFLQQVGWWGPLLLILILSMQVLVAVIPGHILMIAGGYLYGFGDGLLLNLTGTVLASQLAFVLARQAGRPLVTRFVAAQRLDHWQRAAPRQGFFFFLIFFWVPLLPSNLMNFVAGLGTISFWEFLAANMVGRLPGVILVTLIGSHGLELSGQQGLFLAVGGVILFVAARLVANKVQRHYFA